MSPGIIERDGYVRIVEERDGVIYEHAFFVELDRTTITLYSLAARASAYLEHYRSGGYAVSRAELSAVRNWMSPLIP